MTVSQEVVLLSAGFGSSYEHPGGEDQRQVLAEGHAGDGAVSSVGFGSGYEHPGGEDQREVLVEGHARGVAVSSVSRFGSGYEYPGGEDQRPFPKPVSIEATLAFLNEFDEPIEDADELRAVLGFNREQPGVGDQQLVLDVGLKEDDGVLREGLDFDYKQQLESPTKKVNYSSLEPSTVIVSLQL